MEIILYEDTFERIKHQLKETAPSAIPILMHDDGSLSRDGIKIESEDAKPDVAFASTDLFHRGPAREFMICLIKSETVRWLQSGAAGFDHPIFGTLAEKGIRITKSNAAAISISEFVIASVLNVFQPFRERRELQDKKEWTILEFKEVYGTKWLIIGLGNIGQEVAKRASALGGYVIGVRRRPMGNEPAAEVITPVKIKEVLPSADVVVISAPLNPETKHLVDRSFLKSLNPSAILVNIARGSVIDENALLESLDNGIPSYAVLDVFETEPLPQESPLWSHPRVQVTAHSAPYSPGFHIRGDMIFLENLKRYQLGQALNFEVDKSELVSHPG